MSAYGVLTKSYWLGYYRATTSSTATWYGDDDPLNPLVPQPTAGPSNANPYLHWWAAASPPPSPLQGAVMCACNSLTLCTNSLKHNPRLVSEGPTTSTPL